MYIHTYYAAVILRTPPAGNIVVSAATEPDSSIVLRVSALWWPVLPADPNAPLTARSIGQAVSALLPHDAIVVDEAITAAGGFWEHSATAAGHDVLAVTGGSIGIGLPLALGAAVACPDRRVIALQADGSAMYTIQSLWCADFAEKLSIAFVPICDVICANSLDPNVVHFVCEQKIYMYYLGTRIRT